ncbi:hypothetical protein ACFE04_002047 [Oxalis oulophora]
MKFNFSDVTSDTNTPPKDKQVQWVPLQNHPVFTSSSDVVVVGAERNLLAWDEGGSRVYYWDSINKCLHRLSIRLGDPNPTSVFAAIPSKVLQTDVDINFDVQTISINKNGSALLLAASHGLCVVYLYGRNSTKDNNTIICKTVSVGSQIYFNVSNVIRTLRASWHPCSDSHLGVLSSDSVFRATACTYYIDMSKIQVVIFVLSAVDIVFVDLVQPEQEYYLQPVEPGRSRNAASICPVDFSFGGDHLWDKFSVFVLFSDGSVYILCPVVPFGSQSVRITESLPVSPVPKPLPLTYTFSVSVRVKTLKVSQVRVSLCSSGVEAILHKWESILEIFSDAQNFGPQSSSSTSNSNLNLAILWLESTFPELANQAIDGGNLNTVKAQPFPLLDASLALQGPLHKVCYGKEDEVLAVRAPECEGRAVSFLYNLIRKDSVIVTAWSGGQLQIDALADEIQPVWTIDSPPRFRVDSNDRVLAFAMICESTLRDSSVLMLDHMVWSGQPPPLLRLAIMDLALTQSGSLITMFVDPLVNERIFCLHGGGIDSVVLHFLPFTSQASGKDVIKPPSVHPVLSTCQGEDSNLPSLVGFISLADSFGYSWVVAVTTNRECVVLEMKTWNLLLPVQFKPPISLLEEEVNETNSSTPDIISKELLSGPKGAALLPHASPNLRSVAADSIEGRSKLHHYFKLFHENYVEYAHKVYFELKHHGPHLKKIVDDQHARLAEAKEKLLKVEEKQSSLEERLSRAVHAQNLLEDRMQHLRNLPGAHKKPLSTAEREFKSELEHFTGVELDALHSSIETVRARLRKYAQSPKSNVSKQRKQILGRKNYGQDAQISKLQSSIAKLSLVNDENTRKVKLVESALKTREISS